MPKYQHVWVSTALYLWYDAWVLTAVFLINFLKLSKNVKVMFIFNTKLAGPIQEIGGMGAIF